MQLFVLDYDPEKAAVSLCDVHLRKMCLETAQILSGVLFLQGKERLTSMPRAYHVRHPVVLAVNTPEKINWVILYNEALHREYFRRFGKNHVYASLCGNYRFLLYVPGKVLSPELLDFFRDFRGVEITENDLVQAYRCYYRFKKTQLHRWNYTASVEPQWLENEPF